MDTTHFVQPIFRTVRLLVFVALLVFLFQAMLDSRTMLSVDAATQSARAISSLNERLDTGVAGFLTPAQSAISAARGHDDMAYHIAPTDDGYRVENAAHKLHPLMIDPLIINGASSTN